MKKFLTLLTFGFISMFVTINAHAASFEDMADHVESGSGLVYNPISKGLMTKESSIEYLKIAKENLGSTNAENNDHLDKILDNAYVKTKNLKVIPNSEQKGASNMLRGSSIPTEPYYLDGIVYSSSLFLGSGWRYGGYRFLFRDYNKNPYFGVAATKHSFNFYIVIGDPVVVPADGVYRYYPSHGVSVIKPYFSTYIPISGSRYYIQ